MQYEKLLKSKAHDPRFPYPSSYPSLFEKDLFFKVSSEEFQSASLKLDEKRSTISRRELLRIRVLEKISNHDIPGKAHFKQYIRYKFQKNCKPNTIRNDYTGISLFLIFIRHHNKTGLDQLSRSDLENFIEHEQGRELKPATLKTRLASLYAFIRFLVDNKVLDIELLERKIHIKQPVALPKSIDPDDEKRILSVLDTTRDRAMILLLLRTGMRIGELLNTTMSDINLEEQMIRIYESEKTGCGRVVYFGNDAAEALYNWLMERDFSKERLFYGQGRYSMSYAAARKVFNKYIDKAGLSHRGYTLHCLRHTYATRLLNARMPIECLRDLLGHHNLEQTRRYANLSDKTREEEFFRAMAIIEGGTANEHEQLDH